MKRLVKPIPLITMMAIAITSMTASGSERYGTPTVTVAHRQTAIPNAPARVKSPRIPNPKLLRNNPHRAVHYVFATDQDDDILILDEDLITGYRRRDLTKVEKSAPIDPNGELSEDIRWRLFLARQLALLKHKEKAHA
jgi:hypothetical protein